MTGIQPTYVGAGCKHGHCDADGKSVRYRSTRACVECVAERNAGRERRSVEEKAKARLNREREERGMVATFVGKPCRNGHNDADGRALRYVGKGTCVVCRQISKGKWEAARKAAELYKRPAAETFRGKACAFGHAEADGLCVRYVSTRHCVKCATKRSAERKRDWRMELDLPPVSLAVTHIYVPRDVGEYRFETPPPRMPTREMMMRRR